MAVFCEILYRGKLLFCAIWYLILLILRIFLIPFIFFFSEKFIENFDEIITNAALKLLKIIWRVLMVCLLILLALIIFLLGPILWPVYLGILVLRPQFAAYILSIKIF